MHKNNALVKDEKSKYLICVMFILQPLWMMDPKSITDDMHEEFYRFIGNVYDKPRYVLQYKIDAPLNIRALFYVPEYKPSMWLLWASTKNLCYWCL